MLDIMDNIFNTETTVVKSNVIKEKFLSEAEMPAIRRKRKYDRYCGNCGRKGHLYRECTDDITSFGVIAIRRKENDSISESKKKELNLKESNLKELNKKESNLKELNQKESNLKETIPLRMLLVQRKDTMAYVDLIRGRYPDIESLKEKHLMILFEELIPEEREKLKKYCFDDLWDKLWINHNSKCYKNEKDSAKAKFSLLDIDYYLSKTHPKWSFTEFGIPKGRRNMKETNRQCAEREFREETGYKTSDYRMITMEPHIYETFVGTNGKRYKHVYYVAEVLPQAKDPVLDPHNKNQIGEVKDILWMTELEAQSVIREYDTAKKEVITKVFNNFAKFS